MSISKIFLSSVLATTLLVLPCNPAHANIFGKSSQPVPQWGLDAAKTHTPDYDKDAASVVLFDE